MSDHVRTYGARPNGYRPAPKPANFDELTAAAIARRDATNAAARAAAADAFQTEHGRYRDQASRAGVHPGTLQGLLDQNGQVI